LSEPGSKPPPKPKDTTFSIIHHRGDPTRATTLDGYEVQKHPRVYIPEWSAWVNCADYHMEHFVYLDPVAYLDNKHGRWFAMCTCGSPAVIVGEDVYGTDGGMLVCYFHAAFNRHTTGDGREWT
jgi:hypothetical protein